MNNSYTCSDSWEYTRDVWAKELQAVDQKHILKDRKQKLKRFFMGFCGKNRNLSDYQTSEKVISLTK